jgi:hypothetical protein
MSKGIAVSSEKQELPGISQILELFTTIGIGVADTTDGIRGNPTATPRESATDAGNARLVHARDPCKPVPIQCQRPYRRRAPSSHVMSNAQIRRKPAQDGIHG